MFDVLISLVVILFVALVIYVFTKESKKVVRPGTTFHYNGEKYYYEYKIGKQFKIKKISNDQLIYCNQGTIFKDKIFVQ